MLFCYMPTIGWFLLVLLFMIVVKDSCNAFHSYGFSILQNQHQHQHQHQHQQQKDEFIVQSTTRPTTRPTARPTSLVLQKSTKLTSSFVDPEVHDNESSQRRTFLFQYMVGTIITTTTAITTTTVAVTTTIVPSFGIANAAAVERPPLSELLYKIIRVREATQQESRLISTGYFKDTQRANIKLAIKFMIENYKLNDAFVTASSYIDGTTATRIEAGQIGQRAVQNLYTILEYFDSSDVQNLKVGQSLALSGRDSLVLNGLDATRQSIDEFLSYFPKSTIDNVIAKVEYENEMNVKEFDPALGKLINMPITKYK